MKIAALLLCLLPTMVWAGPVPTPSPTPSYIVKGVAGVNFIMLGTPDMTMWGDILDASGAKTIQVAYLKGCASYLVFFYLNEDYTFGLDYPFTQSDETKYNAAADAKLCGSPYVIR